VGTVALADKFRDLRSDPNGSDPASDGGEMGMFSLHRMLTDRLTAPENAGFVRSDAALAVIFLSDATPASARHTCVNTLCINVSASWTGWPFAVYRRCPSWWHSHH
jgi:hypothetical protein